MAVAAERLSRELASIYRREFGITVAEWRVLAHLNQSGSVSVREIHERVDMDKPKVSRAATRLESSGYITKTTNPADARLLILELTTKGRGLVAKIIPLAQQYEQQIVTELCDRAEPLRGALKALIDPDIAARRAPFGVNDRQRDKTAAGKV
ncbi:MarR family winged helix-turn-helix transcriptional regulator [Candidatus Rhodobacter oscarellae]|uniref:MarR family winged helix-turn-helix transcriptional regulator n=1 Tax=Candidatus Rhodobacter oscarellae TaxID=1675527 RepID=UPI001F2DEA00|nr:MarR family winged helix-turn-helix transcriptional regulator [Candidatus Rhodobacter lobularis]